LTIAKKWARNARVHIVRVLLPIQLSSAFLQYEDLYQDNFDIEVWNPPPPPIIKFIQNSSQSKQSPKNDSTINKRSNTHKPNTPPKKTMTYKSVTETDNHTITTVNTQDSYIQDTISDLQNTSQQHQQLLEDLQTQNQQQQQSLVQHSAQIEETNTSLQTHVSNFNSRLATLEEEQQVQQRLHDKIQEESTQH
jgi:chromosome segregation ATPase